MNFVLFLLDFFKSSDTNAPPYSLHTYLQFVPFDILINADESGTINLDLPNCNEYEAKQ